MVLSKLVQHVIRTRYFSSTTSNGKKQICIIGSGPAGFYFAQHILKVLPECSVDLYEKLPVPFGLVRYGVAPDHPEVKNVINTFTKTAQNPNFRFFGNVDLGKDITFNDLKEAYHAVVLSFGCSEDKKLDIANESLPNVLSAREFVGWYNGLPSDSSLQPSLDCEAAVILGQGNVAVDVARILLTPIDILKKTDITEYSLDILSRSKIKKVYLVGRRGPLQVAFTIKEFREMTKLPNVVTRFLPGQMDISQYVADLPRARKRLTELMIKTATTKQEGSKEFVPVFYRKPKSIEGKEKPEAITFQVNTTDDPLNGKIVETNEVDRIECGLILRSIGYRGVSPDDLLPWNSENCLVDTSPGVYGAGWIHSGPTGVILSTMNSAFRQADVLANDVQSGKLDTSKSKPGYQHIGSLLNSKGVKVITFEGWKKIDKVESERGSKIGKPREKIVDINEMISIGVS